MTARVANIGFGVWLMVSAFLWQHSTDQRVNAVAVGALVALLALLARRGRPWARPANMLLAGWLMLSVLVLRPAEATTAVNHLFVGLAILSMALLPSLPWASRRSP